MSDKETKITNTVYAKNGDTITVYNKDDYTFKVWGNDGPGLKINPLTGATGYMSDKELNREMEEAREEAEKEKYLKNIAFLEKNVKK